MAYVSAYEYDAFVCFADEDNQLLPPAKQAWVDNLTSALEKLLAERGVTGARIAAAIPGNVPRQGMLEVLEKSATVLLILSRACLQAPWLSDPLVRARLLRMAVDRRDSVFLASKNDVLFDEEPAELRDLKHHVFWQKENGVPVTLGLPSVTEQDSKPYYAKAFDLASAMANRLIKLRGGAPSALSVSVKRDAFVTVYLAEAPAELESARSEVERYLRQAGIEVVPEGRLPAADTDFASAVDNVLSSCGVFVQLLNDGAADADAQRRVRRQFERADRLAVPRVMQWRDPGLNLGAIASADQRALLMGKAVRAESLPDFCQAVKDAARRPTPSTLPRAGLRVFVDVLQRDQLDEVKSIFRCHEEVDWAWYEVEGRLKVDDLKMVCKVHSAIIVFWGKGNSGPIQKRFDRFLAQWRAFKKPDDLVRIFDGPPEDKPEFEGTTSLVIAGRDRRQFDGLRDFIRRLPQATP